MRYSVFILIALLLGGCTAVKAVVAMNKSTKHFQSLENDSRVKYEAGAEVNAQVVANNLDKAIEVIENKQYRKFSKPVIIYILATEKSVSSFCVNSKVGACVANERLFISSKKEITPERISKFLTHELSHLHMGQYLGMWKWHSNVPLWFREGLAVYASDGGGAEYITKEEAKKAIVSGEMFTPNKTGSLLFQKTAYSFGLKPHMFYRQAGLFISWLKMKNKQSFEAIILNIQAGEETFEEAMLSAYGVGILELWSNFTNEQKI